MDVEEDVKEVQFIVAGHVILGDPKKTKRLHEEMIAAHIKTVRSLIEINYHARVGPELRRRSN